MGKSIFKIRKLTLIHFTGEISLARVHPEPEIGQTPKQTLEPFTVKISLARVHPEPPNPQIDTRAVYSENWFSRI